MNFKMNLNMTSRGKIAIIASLVIVFGMLLWLGGHKAQGNTLSGAASQGVEGIPDYHLIPILNTQGTETKQMYLNTQVTPALFFATWCDKCQKDIPTIQDKLNKMGTGMHKPLVLVSTFSKTSDRDKAIADTKDFQQKYKVNLSLAVQVGPPTQFIKQVPSLVYIDDQGKTQVITDEKAIMDALDKILTLPSQQPSKTAPAK